MNLFERFFAKKATTSPQQGGGHVVLHVRRDATIMALQESRIGAHWIAVTLERLEKELESARQQGASIIYSRDDAQTEPSKEVELVFKVIMSHKLPIQLRPSPPVPLPQ